MPDTSTIIDSETASTILKWAVTILIAGFIAQFGKKFANYLMERLRSIRKGKKQSETAAGEIEGGTAGIRVREGEYTAAYQAAAEKARLKLEKKKSKNLAKGRKK